MANKPMIPVCYMGIDPGWTTGAITTYWLGDYNVYDVMNLYEDLFFKMMKDKQRILRIAIEKISPSPIMANVHGHYMYMRGLLDAYKMPYECVSPRTWQTHFCLPKKEKKSDKPSLIVARELFPNKDLSRQKDHNRADSLLITRWAQDKLE